MPKAKTIFVVDDDDQFLIHQVLKQHLPEVTIHALSDGEALLHQLMEASPPPSLVLLDLNMPRMGGLAALTQLRQDDRYQHLPVVILTTSDSAADQAKARQVQASEYAVKPTTIAGLNQLLLRLIQRWL